MDRLLLVVEDDPSLREVIRLGLEGEGYRIVVAEDGPSALIAFATYKPDLVLLDVMLPGLDGFTVCRELRKISLIPIVMLTARASTADVVEGLESGADDYVVKPFGFGELAARVRAHIRRTEGQARRARARLRSGDLELDLIGRKARRGETELRLTMKEFDLLAELMRNKGAVLSRDLLLNQVWGYDYYGDSRTVDVHVRWLREKIEDDPSAPVRITTVRGVGYRFEA